MITDQGKDVINKFFAGLERQIIGSLALGIGSTAATAADTHLDYEVARVPVASVNSDTANNKVIFKAAIPINSIYKVYEVGGYSVTSLNDPKYLGITDPTAVWTNAVLSATNARASTSTLKIDYVTSGTTNAELLDMGEDLSNFQGIVAFAFHVSANLSSLRVRLGTDSSNYYEFLIASPSVGFNSVRLNVSSATVTGVPDWAAISYLAIRPSATGAGGGSIYFEGIRFESLAAVEQLVVRKVLAAPVTLDLTVASDIEYPLVINIT